MRPEALARPLPTAQAESPHSPLSVRTWVNISDLGGVLVINPAASILGGLTPRKTTPDCRQPAEGAGRPYLHLPEAWEVSGGDLMLPLDLRVDLSQVVHQLFLFALFTEDVGHLLLEGADDVGVDLCRRGQSGRQGPPGHLVRSKACAWAHPESCDHNPGGRKPPKAHVPCFSTQPLPRGRGAGLHHPAYANMWTLMLRPQNSNTA